MDADPFFITFRLPNWRTLCFYTHGNRTTEDSSKTKSQFCFIKTINLRDLEPTNNDLLTDFFSSLSYLLLSCLYRLALTLTLIPSQVKMWHQ